MVTKNLHSGVVHKTPKDLKEVILSSPVLIEEWQSLTPLARNEWICWIDSAKKMETRNRRIDRLKEVLPKGKRRPCCWEGCSHR